MHKIVAIDTETTGLNINKGDRIIEIACVIIKKNKIESSYHTYLNVNKKISKESYLIHKIKKEKIKASPKFKDVYKKIDRILDNSIIVSHNAPFDIKFIKNEYKIIGKKRYYKAIDTLKISKKIFNNKKNNLRSVCKRLRIKIEGELHNALTDALLVAKIYLKLKARQKKVRVS